MRIAIAQINSRVGDLEGNRARILAAYAYAAERCAELVVFPELIVTGYPPLDLVYDRALGAEDRDAVWKYLERRYGLATQSPPDPQLLALASLCHVLLNTNEFIYVD